MDWRWGGGKPAASGTARVIEVEVPSQTISGPVMTRPCFEGFRRPRIRALQSSMGALMDWKQPSSVKSDAMKASEHPGMLSRPC